MKSVAVMASLAFFASLAGGCSASDDEVEANPGSDSPDGGEPARLSGAFSNLCATCHGPEGRGKDKNPAIPGARDEQGYIARVRSGGGQMPAFDTSLISDAELKADYAWLTTKRN
jgi:cytochrome c551